MRLPASRSLTRQTIAVVLLAELLCAMAFSAIALMHERRIRFRAFDVMLQGRADSVLGAVQDAEDPEDNVTVDPFELRLPPEDVYAVYNRGGRLLGSSQKAPAELIQRQEDGFSDRHSGGKGYRVIERSAMRVIDRAENGGTGLQRPVTILYAAPTRHIWHEILEAANFYMLLSLVLLALTAALMIQTLRRVLGPIDELALEAGGVSSNSLHFNPPESVLCLRELRPLALALSTAIGGLREAFQKEQRFVSDAAHELKTAVAVVRSTIQVLMIKSRSREEYVLGLDRLLNDNLRVEQLIAQMLLLAHLEEGPALCPVVDLASGVYTAIGHLQSLAEQRAVTIAAIIASDVPVRVPVDRIEALVSNLVVNAVQHSQAGATIAVSLVRKDGRAILEVQDEGEGISEKALPHVFERFFREDISRTRGTGGTGLGLAISKSIVESAGGSIAIESIKGRGTTVTASFSLA